MPTLKMLKDQQIPLWLALLLMGSGGIGGAKAFGFGQDEKIAQLEGKMTELRVDIATMKGQLSTLLERIPAR